MSDNALLAFIILVCFFSCNGCPGSHIVNRYVDSIKPCTEAPK